MRVTLLHHTPMNVLIEGVKMPYQSPKVNEKVVKKVWDSGHRSIARHGVTSFKIEGVSQSLLRQISRHPHINLTVKSSRYCDMSNANIVIPPFVKADDVGEYFKDMENIKYIYEKWNNKQGYTKGQNREISKMFLPLASTTDLILSGNYQALYEFLQLRLCIRAEWEIRELAQLIADNLKEIMPTLFADLGCRGKEYGYCPEEYSCGLYPKKQV